MSQMDKKYDYLQVEERICQQWDAQKIYATPSCAKQLYSVDTPPPTVSGSLHIGHVFSYTQTDIIARYKRMDGYDVFYPFGFDDNGLPTERYVEQQRKTSAQKIGRSAFVQACLEETQKVEKTFENLWKKVGLSVDWDASYSTIDERTRKISQASFIDLYKKGHIYRKDEPALYDIAYRTSVAQADLEDVEKESFFNDVAFTTEDGNQQLIIGTTRPELLPSCVALLYHPDDERYKHLAGYKARVPLYDYLVPIIADKDVEIDKGTGLVMCCTFGDKTDIVWFKRHDLPYRQSIGFDGRWLEIAGPLAGLKVHDARTKVLELLEEAGVLLRQKKITHVVSVYERSKKEIEYVMLPQWFLKILPFKQELLKLADELNWYPSFMKSRFVNWVENLQWDWCLSRQRYFGVPFPVWYDKHTGEIYLPEDHELPVDPQEMKKPASAPEGVELLPDTDVMDTWNTSSLTPYICKAVYEGTADDMFGDEEPGFLPMGMRPQAHDIIRTWAFYTMVKTWLHHKKLPWKDIVISGHVLSSKNEKLSKSKGGSKALKPEQLLQEYSADVVRYWTASGTLGQDVPFADNTLKIGRKLTVKLWNAARFVQEHIQGFVFDAERVPSELDDINAWILDRSSRAFEQYQKYFEKNEFSLAVNAAEQFFWSDVCDSYFELIKKQLFNPEEYSSEELYATKWTLYQIMLRLLQLFAPIIPFITEELYHILFKEKHQIASLHQTKFADIQMPYRYPDQVMTVKKVLQVIEQVRKLKSDHKLSLKTPLSDLTLIAQEADLNAFCSNEQTIKGVTGAYSIVYTTQSAAGTHLQQDPDETWSARVNLI